jgi:hypothetical protein
MNSLLHQANDLQRQLLVARERYLALTTEARQRRLEFLAASDDFAAARLHQVMRQAEITAAQAHVHIGELETAARHLYCQWLARLRSGDTVLAYIEGGWMEVRVKFVKKSSIKLTNGSSYSNRTGLAWRGRTALRMPALSD